MGDIFKDDRIGPGIPELRAQLEGCKESNFEYIKCAAEQLLQVESLTAKNVKLQQRIAELEASEREYRAQTDPLLDKLEPMADRIIELEKALQMTLGQCQYWLKTYRSHTGFMNSTHLMEQESLTRCIAVAKKLLEGK